MASSSGPDPAAAGPVKVFLYDDTTSRQAFAKPAARGASISKWATSEPSYFKYPGVDEDDAVPATVDRAVATSHFDKVSHPSQATVRHEAPPNVDHPASLHAGWDVPGQAKQPDLEKHAREDSGYSVQAASEAPKTSSSFSTVPAHASTVSSSAVSALSSIQIAGRAKQAATPSSDDAWGAWQADHASAANSGAAAFAKRAQISASPAVDAATLQVPQSAFRSSSAAASMPLPVTATSASRSDSTALPERPAQSEDPWASYKPQSGNNAYELRRKMGSTPAPVLARPEDANRRGKASLPPKPVGPVPSQGRSSSTEKRVTSTEKIAVAPQAPNSVQDGTTETDDWASYKPSGPSGGAEAYAKRAALSKGSSIPAARSLQKQPSIRAFLAERSGNGKKAMDLAKVGDQLVSPATTRKGRSTSSTASSVAPSNELPQDEAKLAQEVIQASAEKLLDFDSPTQPPTTDRMDLSIISELSGLRFEADPVYAQKIDDFGSERNALQASGLVRAASPSGGEPGTPLDAGIPLIQSPLLAPTHQFARGSPAPAAMDGTGLAPTPGSAASEGIETFEQAVNRALKLRNLQHSKQQAVLKELLSLGKKEKLKCTFSEDFLVLKVKQAIQLVELDEEEDEEEL